MDEGDRSDVSLSRNFTDKEIAMPEFDFMVGMPAGSKNRAYQLKINPVRVKFVIKKFYVKLGR